MASSASQTGDESPGDSPLSTMARFLTIQESDLHCVPYSIIEEACTALKFSLQKQAILFTALGKPNEKFTTKSVPSPNSEPIDRIADHFHEAELMKHRPWMLKTKELADQRKVWSQESIDEKRAQFVERCKAKVVTADDVLISIYCLFGNESALDMLRSLIIHTNGQQRILHHNFYIASLKGESFLVQYGAVLMRLEWPLFPPTPEFSVLNTLLLEETIQIAGAGGRIPSVYKQLVEGAGYLPVVPVPPDGTWAVETTDVEHAISSLNQRMSTAERKINQGRGRGGERFFGNNRRNQRNYPRGGDSQSQPDPVGKTTGTTEKGTDF